MPLFQSTPESTYCGPAQSDRADLPEQFSVLISLAQYIYTSSFAFVAVSEDLFPAQDTSSPNFHTSTHFVDFH